VSAKRVAVILENIGGELDRATVTVRIRHDDPEESANLAIHEVIEDWILSPGDTIRIEEVAT
jgi:hypothetical protein